MTNATIDIKWAKQYSTAQVYSNGAEVALSNSKAEQIGPFVWCKDFLHDAIRARIHATPSSIYGYQTGAAELAMIELEQPYVLLTNSASTTLASELENILDFMRQADEDMASAWAVPTEYRVCNDPPAKYAKCGVSLWTASPLWMISPPAFSLWTLLLRNGSVHKIGDDYMDTIQAITDGKKPAGVSNDGMYLKYAMPGILTMIEKGLDGTFSKVPMPKENKKEWFQKVIAKNYPSPGALPVSSLHHYGGCVSFGEASNKKFFPDLWNFPKNPKKAPSICHA